MQVILLQDIKGLGRKYDTKQVKDGYVRNFLLPRKLVKIATDSAIKELETQKAELERQKQELKAKLEKLAKDLYGKEFRFNVKTGEKGEIFGSVSKEDIKTRIVADINADLRGYIKDIEINLERSLKTLGEHQVEIDLSAGVKTKIKLQVLEQK